MNLTRLISILHNQKNSYMNVQLKERTFMEELLYYLKTTIKQEDLNKRLQIDKGAVTRILNTLKEKGLIIKEIAKEDKRNQMISLTEKGKVLYPQIKNIIEKTNEVMLKDINQNQQTLLNELILKMKDNLEDKNEK